MSGPAVVVGATEPVTKAAAVGYREAPYRLVCTIPGPRWVRSPGAPPEEGTQFS
jgi:hypothetical protein